MVEGIKTIAKSVIATAIAGGLMGVLVGALTGDYLLWVGVMLFIGANFGLAIAYGFLPES